MSTSLGSWNVIGSSGVVCIHTYHIPGNKLVCVERPHENPYLPNANTGGVPAAEISFSDSGSGFKAEWKSVRIDSNAFCGGHAMLGDGSILHVGGDARIDTGLQDGRRIISKYTPCTDNCNSNTGSFSAMAPMSTQRWYPTVVTLEDGSAMIISGTTDNLDFSMLNRPIRNPTYEYYPPKQFGTWPKNLEILEWAFPFVLYPMAFQLPSGNVFLFVSNKTIIIDPKTDEIKNSVRDLVVPNHFPFIYPYTPHMVMLPLTKKNKYKPTLLLCGGSEIGQGGAAVSSAQCYKVSPDANSPSEWTRDDDMPVGRVMPDSVLLPGIANLLKIDGKVLFLNGAGWGVAGGQGGDAQYAGSPVFETSLYDPEAAPGKKWSTVAKSSVPRLYHSGAILMPDGYVVTTGSEMSNYIDFVEPNTNMNCYPKGRSVCSNPYEYRIERYTPYYLTTNQERPNIAEAPLGLTYNSSFIIKVSPKVTKVTFIRFSTTTHSTNTDQRMIELDIIGRNADSLALRAPENGALAPPGNWMLFVLADGVPSVAKVIKLHAGPQSDIDRNVFHDLFVNRSVKTFHGEFILGIFALFYLLF